MSLASLGNGMRRACGGGFIRPLSHVAATAPCHAPWGSALGATAARCAAAAGGGPRGSALLHGSARSESPTLLAGGLTVAAGALAARYALQAYERAQGGAGASGGEQPGAAKADAGEGAGKGGTEKGEAAAGGGAGAGVDAGAGAGARTHKSFLASALAKRFYKGGFEEKMTRREAALILGVRESATPERVRERHRKMLMLNHPDMGGSTFLAGKINEAKDFLLKGGGGK